MAPSDILYTVSDGVGLVVLNRPDKLNALRRATFEELVRALDDVAVNHAVGAVVLTGQGRAFSAGADIAAYAGGMTVDDLYAFIDLAHRAAAAIEENPKPVIAAVNGHALGGGLELALACDLVVAASTAVFGLPEIKLGLLPGGGATQRLPRLVGPHKAREMLFLGESISAEEAYRMGLINRLYPPDALREAALALAGQIGRAPPRALQTGKLLVRRGLEAPLETGLALEQGQMALLFETAEAQRRIHKFIQGRRPSGRPGPGAER